MNCLMVTPPLELVSGDVRRAHSERASVAPTHDRCPLLHRQHAQFWYEMSWSRASGMSRWLFVEAIVQVHEVRKRRSLLRRMKFDEVEHNGIHRWVLEQPMLKKIFSFLHSKFTAVCN